MHDSSTPLKCAQEITVIIPKSVKIENKMQNVQKAKCFHLKGRGKRQQEIAKSSLRFRFSVLFEIFN